MSEMFKYVVLQVQFVAIFTHQFQLLFTECNYPKGFMIWIALHGIMFLFLFSDFYKVRYTNSKAVKSSNNGACMVSSVMSRFVLCFYKNIIYSLSWKMKRTKTVLSRNPTATAL